MVYAIDKFADVLAQSKTLPLSSCSRLPSLTNIHHSPTPYKFSHAAMAPITSFRRNHTLTTPEPCDKQPTNTGTIRVTLVCVTEESRPSIDVSFVKREGGLFPWGVECCTRGPAKTDGRVEGLLAGECCVEQLETSEKTQMGCKGFSSTEPNVHPIEKREILKKRGSIKSR